MDCRSRHKQIMLRLASPLFMEGIDELSIRQNRASIKNKSGSIVGRLWVDCEPLAAGLPPPSRNYCFSDPTWMTGTVTGVNALKIKALIFYAQLFIIIRCYVCSIGVDVASAGWARADKVESGSVTRGEVAFGWGNGSRSNILCQV